MKPELVLQFLQTQKALDILKASIMFLDWDYANPMPWVPIKDSFCADPFLPNTFTEAVESGMFLKVPVIKWACKDEGLMESAEKKLERMGTSSFPKQRARAFNR